ncbi:MAG: sulfatase [Candidatus Hydrogenedentota bacterium]
MNDSRPPEWSRREILRLLAGGTAAATLGTQPVFSQPARKPNVIVIYTDDQGSVDMGAYGARDLVTPHMDALAARGVRFTQFYAPAPVCSPSRAGLLTGRYPVSAGVPGNVSSKPGNAGMPPEQDTMAEMFEAAGYATAHIGKWHLGYTQETMPNAQGFDHSFGHMGGCIDNYSHFFYWSGPNRHDLYRNGEEVYLEGEHFQDLMVREAGEFITGHRDEPFFMYVAFNSPHYPYQGYARWLKHYQDQGLHYPRDLYAAFLSTQDEHIGQLVALIDDAGLRNDTIIVLQSDHGHSTEERAHFGGGSAGPYRGAKFSMFEGGLRVPAIISWPGHVPEGEVRDQMAHGCDWMPTLAALAGVDTVPEGIDGRSIADVISDASAPTPHEHLIWQVKEGENATWAVREGDWKLLVNVRDTTDGQNVQTIEGPFLVNLSDDLGETTNVAADHPDIVARLSKIHEEWFAAQSV